MPRTNLRWSLQRVRNGKGRRAGRRYPAVLGGAEGEYWVAFADLPRRVFRAPSPQQAIAAAQEGFAGHLNMSRLAGCPLPPPSPLGAIPDWLAAGEERDLVHLLLPV